MGHNIREVREKQLAFYNSGAIPIPSIWRHYKSGVYIVTDCTMSESKEEMQVCYRSVDNPTPYPWSRPLSEWMEQVEYGGETVARYTRVAEDLDYDFAEH